MAQNCYVVIVLSELLRIFIINSACIVNCMDVIVVETPWKIYVRRQRQSSIIGSPKCIVIYRGPHMCHVTWDYI